MNVKSSMGYFFYFFFSVFLLGFSDLTDHIFEFLQMISFTIYLNNQLPNYLEIFFIGLSYFQNNLFPSFGNDQANQNEKSLNYHTFYSHIILDQDPYDRIIDRTGASSSYMLNGFGLIFFSLLGWLLDFIINKIKKQKIKQLKNVFIVKINQSICLPHLFFICLQLVNYSQTDRFNSFSFFCSFLALIYHFYVLGIFAKISFEYSKFQSQNELLQKNFKYLYQEYNLEKQPTRIIPLIGIFDLAIKSLIIILTIVLYNMP